MHSRRQILFDYGYFCYCIYNELQLLYNSKHVCLSDMLKNVRNIKSIADKNKQYIELCKLLLPKYNIYSYNSHFYMENKNNYSKYFYYCLIYLKNYNIYNS